MPATATARCTIWARCSGTAPRRRRTFTCRRSRPANCGCSRWAVTEPTTGTDTTKLKTTAVRKGDRYVVNGQKVWISRIQHSDLMILLARTTPLAEVRKKSKGLSIFLVDLHAAIGKGMSVKPIRNMVNHETNELFFDNLEIPADSLIGEEGKGFRYILDGLNAERTLIAAECIGDGWWFIDKVDELRKGAHRLRPADRPEPGRAVPDRARLRQRLGGEPDALRGCRKFDAGEDCGAEANMAKLLAADASWEAANACIQFHGGFGFAAEYDVERKFRETRTLPGRADLDQPHPLLRRRAYPRPAALVLRRTMTGEKQPSRWPRRPAKKALRSPPSPPALRYRGHSAAGRRPRGGFLRRLGGFGAFRRAASAPSSRWKNSPETMGPTDGRSEILVSRKMTSPLFAALVNAAASHISEQDDVHNGSVFHPAAVVFPAALATAQQIGASGREFIAASVAGYEVGIRVGEFLGRSHYRVFHTTGTAGTIAAAVAVGRLLGLDLVAMLHAIGSAGTQAAGLWEFLRDAADSKQLHTAKAAADGLTAAFLAKDGFTGAKRILEGKQGMAAGMSSDADPAKLTDRLGARWAVIETSFKFHASCRHTHPAADALLQVIEANELRAEQIDEDRRACAPGRYRRARSR